MSKHSDFEAKSKPSAPNEAAPDAESPPRRRFLAGSAALMGTLLVRGEIPSSAAELPVNAAPAAPKGSPAASVVPRAPLAPAPFHALPLGSVKADGWLLRQLELQRDGLTGFAEEILPATAPDSAWKGGNGEDWEKGPYYLKGLIPLAYTLDDAGLKAKAQAWIEPILASQREDGFFGPKKNDDWWPRMVATYLLRDYAEATGDTRVLPFLTKYYRHMSEKLPGRPLRDWGRARAGDEIDTVLWLYNRTGGEFLLPLADLLHEQAYPWREIFTEHRFLEFGGDFHPKHNVNVPQALKLPAVYAQRSGKAEDKTAYWAGIENLMRDHGTSFGINTGTEMLAGRSSTEGVEFCSIVEKMLSDETALRILGDARIGDDLETLAFNALPAATSKNIHQHVYFTLANNVTAPRGGLGFEQNYDDARTPAPRSGFPCCCYNFHMGWPKLAQNAWAATADGGLAILAYVPSQVSAQVAGGQSAKIVCETNYPFEETIRLSIAVKKTTRFPLQLRIPGWCENAQIKVNGKAQPKAAAGTFATIERAWKNGDVVQITFPMSVRVLPGINDSVSVRRGPLVYSLGMKEDWKPFEKSKIEGFDSYEITSPTPWNFALVLDAQNPAKSFDFIKKTGAANPFETGKAPVALRVNARQAPDWILQPDKLAAFDPPISPIASQSPIQSIELVPFGSQMLRVTDFPVVGTPHPALAAWSENFSSGHADDWIFYGGGWFVRDGQLRASNPNTAAKAVASRAVFSDFTMESDIIVGETGNAGLIFRISNPSIGADAHNGYYAGISAETKQVIFGKSSHKWTEIATKTHEFQAGKTYRMRVEARGPQIRIWVDDMNTPILEARDETFSTGALGVRHYGTQPDKARAAFGNLAVIAI